MITKVRLHNWKSHLDTGLQFGDGTNVLVGIMGSGKTAVLDAISYALFGTLPLVRARVMRLEDLIMNRPRQFDSAEVEVGFIAPDGDEYLVKRVIERGTGTTLSELRRASGELIESPSSTRVTEAIEGVLKMDSDLFERAVYSEQNRLDYFLTLPRGRRMESIDELLGIDKLERARKNMGTLINNVRDRTDDKKAEKARLEQDATLAALPALEQGLKNLKLERQGIQVRLQQLQPKLEEVKAELDRMCEAKLEITRLEKSLREFSGVVDELKRRLDQVRGRLGEAAGVDPGEIQRQVGSLQEKYANARGDMDELGAQLMRCTSRASELKARMEMLQLRLAELDEDIKHRLAARAELKQIKPEEVAKSVERLQSNLRATGDRLATCRTRLRDVQQAVVELEGAGPTCPVCESPLSESKREQLLAQRREELGAREGEAANLEKEFAELNDELGQKLQIQRRAESLAKGIEDLQALEAKHSQLGQELRVVEGEHVKAQAAAEELHADFERSRSEVDRLSEQLSGARQMLQLRLDLKQLEKDHKQKQAESLRIQQELWRVRRGYDEARAQAIAKDHENLIRTQERLRAEAAGMEQLISVKRELVESVYEKLALLRRSEAEIKHLQQAVQSLQVIQNALAQAQTTMRRDFIEAVNGAMNELWRELYPYGDFTGIRLAVEDDYVLQLRNRLGNWVAVEGLTSGGERTCACLTLRIAFAIVLAPTLSWLVLDEPTHNLDAEGIQELATALRERIPDIVKQVLLITHEERLEAAVSGYLYRCTRNKDLDEPTRVEQVTAPEILVRERR